MSLTPLWPTPWWANDAAPLSRLLFCPACVCSMMSQLMWHHECMVLIARTHWVLCDVTDNQNALMCLKRFTQTHLSKSDLKNQIWCGFRLLKRLKIWSDLKRQPPPPLQPLSKGLWGVRLGLTHEKSVRAPHFVSWHPLRGGEGVRQKQGGDTLSTYPPTTVRAFCPLRKCLKG